MAQLPDLVLDSQLETQFLGLCITEHVFDEADGTSSHREARTIQRWQRHERPIGEGGFARVWLENCTTGKDKGRARAVKQIRKSRSGTKDTARELEAISKFSHKKYRKFFVQSFGWYEDSDHLYIAMEYLALGDLHHYLRNHDALSEHDAQIVTRQVCEGLCKMHENGFVHRDLKSGNIMIQAMPPQPWWVKITDFGVTKRSESSVTSKVKGTEGFMPPEWHGFSTDGDQTVSSLSFAVDLWSLGEVAFRLLTKRPTFETLYDKLRYADGDADFPNFNPLMGGATARQFMIALMQPKPGSRLTAHQALEHEWLSNLENQLILPQSPKYPSSPKDDNRVEDLAQDKGSQLAKKDVPVAVELPLEAVRASDDLSAMIGGPKFSFNTPPCVKRAIHQRPDGEYDVLIEHEQAPDYPSPKFELRWASVISVPASKLAIVEVARKGKHRDILFENKGIDALCDYEWVVSPNAKYLALISRPETWIDVWNVDKGRFSRHTRTHRSHGHGIAFTPPGGFLMIGSSQRYSLEIWNVLEKRKLQTAYYLQNVMFDAVLSRDRMVLAIGTSDVIYVHDIRTNDQFTMTIPRHQASVSKVIHIESDPPILITTKNPDPAYRTGHTAWNWRTAEEVALYQEVPPPLSPDTLFNVQPWAYFSTYTTYTTVWRESDLGIQLVYIWALDGENRQRIHIGTIRYDANSEVITLSHNKAFLAIHRYERGIQVWNLKTQLLVEEHTDMRDVPCRLPDRVKGNIEIFDFFEDGTLVMMWRDDVKNRFRYRELGTYRLHKR